MSGTPEGAIVTAVLELLAYRGVFARRINVGPIPAKGGGFRRSRMVGISDILGVLPGGRFLAIECKAPGGRVRPEQADFIAAVNRKGGLAFVAVSTLDVERRLDQEGIR